MRWRLGTAVRNRSFWVNVPWRRPVMVWWHMGAWSGGSGDLDGERVAQRGDVVFVSVNHRLNIFGFLHLGRAFGEEYEAAGTIGMLDLLASLDWVRDNIAAFGGDPDNIMVYGVSGGGAKVAHSLAMPAFAGRYRSAAVMSGHDLWKRNTVATAEEITSRTLAALGVQPGDTKKLQALSQDDLLQAHGQVQQDCRHVPAWGAPSWVNYDIYSPVIRQRDAPYPMRQQRRSSARIAV